ncbi:hypothetical protein ACIBG5_38660 [Kribbella sp. NPDC050241]|uniref:hypothetical protein n=1 Tax=Kribbella sp. NPDC050241 TaxID=3364115 RepID=UPI0037B907A7
MTTSLWLALISSFSRLAGVALGAALTGQAQRRQWTRDRQVGACTAIVVQSTRVQLALRQQWRRAQRVDWAPWNEALAEISLIVATPAGVEAAGEMDELFWQNSEMVVRGELNDETAWEAASQRMEAARLNFINTAKRHVIGSRSRLNRLPIRRPQSPDGWPASPSPATLNSTTGESGGGSNL